MNHVVGLLAVGRQAKRARVNEKSACSKLGNLVPRSSRYSRRPWYTLRTTPRGMESFVTWNTWFSFSVHFFQDRIWLFTMFDPGKSVDEDEIKCFMSYSRVFSVPSFSISRRPWGRGWSMGIQRYFCPLLCERTRQSLTDTRQWPWFVSFRYILYLLFFN